MKHLMDINSRSKPNTPPGSHGQDFYFDIKMKMIRAEPVRF